MNTSATNTDLARLLQSFFCQRLLQQRSASPRTVSSYRDAFRLLLRFAETRAGKPISQLSLADIDAPLVLAFLDDLEGDGTTWRAAVMPALQQSAPFFIMRRSKSRLPCRGSSKCWRSL